MLDGFAEDGYGPISSDYLRAGYKEDDFELTGIVVEEKRVIGAARVNSFFPPTDGEFHLSSAMGTIWIQQLAVIYAFHDIGVKVKDREVYLREFSMKCRSRIVNLESIPLELAVTSRAERGGRIFYRADYDIDAGSFVGRICWFMDAQPHAPA